MTDVRVKYLPSAYRSWRCHGRDEPSVCASGSLNNPPSDPGSECYRLVTSTLRNVSQRSYNRAPMSQLEHRKSYPKKRNRPSRLIPILFGTTAFVISLFLEQYG